jgi:hypothetical protein
MRLSPSFLSPHLLEPPSRVAASEASVYCAGPPGTPDEDLIRVARARWAIEEGLCATRRLVVSPT